MKGQGLINVAEPDALQHSMVFWDRVGSGPGPAMFEPNHGSEAVLENLGQ